jgi:hypothetical protein
MMKTRRLVIAIATVLLLAVCVGFVTTAPIAANQPSVSNGHDRDDQACLPGIETAVRRNPIYQHLYAVLASHHGRLTRLLEDVVDQTSYQALLTKARAVAAKVESGRVVVTLPDGTVVVDTAKVDDPTNTQSSGNSFEHFSEKTVNENHNSRVAILATQLYPCGIGLERKLSTTTGETESYLALRLGQHLDSAGTARLSTVRMN